MTVTPPEPAADPGPRTTEPAASPPPGVDPPRGLGERGRRLWRQSKPAHLPPAQRLLLEEACRIADRLERLDAILRGDERDWMRFQPDITGTVVRVVVDSVLAESRQQALALKALVSELRQGAATAQPSKSEESGLDELARKREERLATRLPVPGV